MSELVFGYDVELRPHTIDRYGRLVAIVFVGGKDAGLELLKAGMAWPTTGISYKPRKPYKKVTDRLSL
jgi:endonuclease YncB( thermonuclease family)